MEGLLYAFLFLFYYVSEMEMHETYIQISDFARELDAASTYELDLSDCYGCARCSSVCKVAAFAALDEPMTPRALLYRAVIGETKSIIESPFIWLCSGCARCEEACPQGVRISEVVRSLRRLALEMGRKNPNAARVNERICMHCGACVVVCPNKAISIVDGGPKGKVANVDPSECRGCGACSSVCPNNAIQQASLNYIEILNMFARKS